MPWTNIWFLCSACRSLSIIIFTINFVEANFVYDLFDLTVEASAFIAWFISSSFLTAFNTARLSPWPFGIGGPLFFRGLILVGTEFSKESSEVVMIEIVTKLYFMSSSRSFWFHLLYLVHGDGEFSLQLITDFSFPVKLSFSCLNLVDQVCLENPILIALEF